MNEDRRRLLVVEDNAVNQLVAQRMLTRIGYDVDLAGNGQEAVDCFPASSYAAILMDCQMPVMDGYEATRAIRQLEGGQTHIPIVAVTAAAMQGDRERCLAAGMDDVVTKPVDWNELNEVLHRFWAAGAADIRSSASEQVIDPRTAAELQGLHTRTGGIAEVVALFSQDGPRQVSALRSAARQHDFEMLRRVAHTLRGSSSMLGATRVAGLCEQIEHAADGQDPAGASDAVTRLESELPAALTELRWRFPLSPA